MTYTLLTHELVGLLDALGLDPHVGFLHQLDHGRPSLALDLLEPFRHPVADRFVITTVNRGMFQADDFQPAAGNDRPGGMVLAAGALREFFGAYERWMIGAPHPPPVAAAATATSTTPAGSDGAAAAPAVRRTFRQALRREVESFAKVLRDGKGWEPFTFAVEPRAGEAAEEDADCGMSSLTI